MSDDGAAAVLPEPGEVISDRYEIGEVIGRGGMGTVLSATNVVTGKRVAIKWMRPGRAAEGHVVQRFIREARAAGRVQHPNIVDVYDVREHDGSLFLVMEHLRGRSLEEVLQDEGKLELAPLLQLMLPAMEGIGAAHRQGVVHRDLKPANVFICQDDAGGTSAKVLDFGISKLVGPKDGGDTELSLSRSGATIGTPHYMAPEQLDERSEVDARADIYACGVLLYRALTGRLPFEASSFASLVLQIGTAEPKDIAELRPDLPAGVAASIGRAMARDPAERFADMDAFAAALREGARVGADGSRTAQAPAPTAPARGPLRIALALAALAAVALSIWVLTRDGRAARVPAGVQPGSAGGATEGPRSPAPEPAREALPDPVPAVAPAAPTLAPTVDGGAPPGRAQQPPSTHEPRAVPRKRRPATSGSGTPSPARSSDTPPKLEADEFF